MARPQTKRRPAAKPRADRSSTSRFAAFGIGAAVIGSVAALVGIFASRRDWMASEAEDAEHAAPDLALDAPRPGTDRAPDAFRPDPTAPVPAGEREGLRPATGPAPSIRG